MARTTPAEVKAITGSTVDDAAVETFIDIATLVIDQVASVCPSISDANLTAAETYYAAHLFVTSPVGAASAQKKSEKFENYSVTHAIGSNTENGVLSTSYGKTSNMLTGGCLQEIEKRQPTLAFGGGA